MGAAKNAINPVIKLPQGTVIGLTLEESLPKPIDAFRGIPYALPPTGDRRFRPAVKVASSPENVIDGSRYGPAAPGKPLLAGGPKLEYSEDCLTANVFRPSSPSTENVLKLPVAIYIHGGAFNRGTSSMHNTASMVAWSEAPFVAVSFNYRIGALGFLPSALTAKEGSLNLGLRDQIVLFEWVKDNIGAFGGDPDNVTLVGLSAGAHSVSRLFVRAYHYLTWDFLQIGHHLMHFTEGKTPLFDRVVIESGAPTSRAVRPYDASIHEEQFKDFLEATGCRKDRPDDEIFPYLRSLPSEVVTSAQTAVFDKYNPSLRWAFQPIIDGDIIPRPPLETWLSGKWHKVPIVTGFNRNEGSLYVDKQMSNPEQFTDFFAKLLPLLSPSDIETIDALYPNPSRDAQSPYLEDRKSVGAQYKRIEAAYAHYAYVAPVRQTAELASKAASAPVYLYQWALDSSIIEGARHGDNMRYEVVDPAVVKISAAQRDIARTTNAYITSFIATGDPNKIVPKDLPLPQWAPYTAEAPKAMVFGAENKELVGGEAGPAAQLLDDTWGRKESEFWWSKVELSQQ